MHLWMLSDDNRSLDAWALVVAKAGRKGEWDIHCRQRNKPWFVGYAVFSGRVYLFSLMHACRRCCPQPATKT